MPLYAKDDRAVKANSGDKAEPVGGGDSWVHIEYLSGLGPAGNAVVRILSPIIIH